jgi:hypothetical protein
MVHHPSSNTNPIINQPETAPPKHRPIACVDMCGEHGKQQVVNYPTRGLSQNGGYPNALSLKGGQKNLMFLYIYIILYCIPYYIILYYIMVCFLAQIHGSFLLPKK